MHRSSRFALAALLLLGSSVFAADKLTIELFGWKARIQPGMTPDELKAAFQPYKIEDTTPEYDADVIAAVEAEYGPDTTGRSWSPAKAEESQPDVFISTPLYLKDGELHRVWLSPVDKTDEFDLWFKDLVARLPETATHVVKVDTSIADGETAVITDESWVTPNTVWQRVETRHGELGGAETEYTLYFGNHQTPAAELSRVPVLPDPPLRDIALPGLAGPFNRGMTKGELVAAAKPMRLAPVAANPAALEGRITVGELSYVARFDLVADTLTGIFLTDSSVLSFALSAWYTALVHRLPASFTTFQRPEDVFSSEPEIWRVPGFTATRHGYETASTYLPTYHVEFQKP